MVRFYQLLALQLKRWLGILKEIMGPTQEHLPIMDIKEDLVLLKSGGAAVVLQTTAVNFALLSEMEQVAIISAFGQTLNSLSFPIQIFIRSKRLDITSYLRMLDKAISTQPNPLLSQLMRRYRTFVQSLIKQNEVLDKHFFIVIPISGLALGIFRKSDDITKKAKTMLGPKQEQVVRQLSRIGLKTTQLSTKALVELFFDIYNPTQESLELPIELPVEIAKTAVAKPSFPAFARPAPATIPAFISQSSPARSHPFVVEELTDSI